jgi:hypothetical protein
MITHKTQDDLKFALVTPSHAPDFERCKLLVESVERCLIDGTKHYIVIDRRDVNLFKQLTSSKVHLLVAEELLPISFFRVPGLKKWWISLRTLPVRNWIFQQLIKISICDSIHENVLVFCDSDNTFIRPFDMKTCLMRNNHLPLLKVNFQNKDVHEWIEASKKILGIEDKAIHPATYVSNMITWYTPNILKMRSHIEKINGKNWLDVLCRYRNISEYMLYGIFVEHIQGLEEAYHFFFDVELIKPSWGFPLNTEAQIKDFFDQRNLKESHIGVMIHSKDNVPVSLYADIIKTLWP